MYRTPLQVARLMAKELRPVKTSAARLAPDEVRTLSGRNLLRKSFVDKVARALKVRGVYLVEHGRNGFVMVSGLP